MAQTPQQRRANEAFAKSEASKRGKAASEISTKKKQKVDKAPISPIWVYVLIFAVCGGLVVEVLRIISNYFS